MNYNKLRKKKPGPRIKLQSFGSYNPRKRKRGRRSRYLKPNHWHVHTDVEFSKIIMRDVEIIWLEENAPGAVISYEKVPNCESMPLFKSGEWNGFAYFVRFTKEQLSQAIMFRIIWWNTRA